MVSFLLKCVTIVITLLFLWLSPTVEANSINCDSNNPIECISNTIQCADNKQECDIICNTDESCSGSTIQCPVNNTCSIHCNGDKSCDGTSHYKMTINCPNNADCNIYCDKWSCPELIVNCPNNAICNIYANNSHSLFWSHIYCHSSNQCNIKCNAYSSCQQATIYAHNTKQLTIQCNQQRSCIDMDIYCPENHNSNKRCKMIGEDLSYRGRHSYLRFYAVNSWDDVDLTTYNAYTLPGDNNRIFCTKNLDYMCIFSLLTQPNPSSNWNCSCPGPEIFPTAKPTLSPPDYISNNTVTIAALQQNITCNNDTNICSNTTVQCNANVTECNVYCNTFESCVGSTIQCPLNNNSECNIHCIGVKSCNSLNYRTLLICEGDNCNIECIGEESCISTNIECNGECNIISSGINALSYAHIRCDTTGKYNCNFQCNSNFACQQIIVRGIFARGLYINCFGKESCKNINIRCPPATDIDNVSCVVSGNDESVHSWLTIFAINGWSDISGNGYIAFIDNSLNSDNRIYCGDRFDAHCTINSNMKDLCECMPPTQSPTIAQPTSAPTFSPTVSPTEFEVIVGASIAFYITMVVAVVFTVSFCVFLVIGSRKEDKIYKQYLELKKSLKKQESASENE